MNMTKKLFLFLLLCYLTKGEYSARCSDNLHSGLTFEALNDGVEGRYRVEWCTMADENVTNWDLVMRYDDTRTPSHCMKYSFDIPPGAVHSRFNERVHLNLNCTNICLSTNLDLIFNGTCYHIKTVLHRGTTSSSPHDSLHYIFNTYPKEHFTNSKVLVRTHSNNEDLIVHWYLGFVPATDYTMKLCTADFKSCVDIGGNCSTAGRCQCEVRCVLRPRYGCYSVRLQQLAPWSVALGLFEPLGHTDHHVCHQPPRPVSAQPAAPPWALGAGVVGVALLLAVLLALLLCRARHTAARRLSVLHDWRRRTETEPVMAAVGDEPDEKPEVLLLYARDCPPFTRVADALRRLLAAAGSRAYIRARICAERFEELARNNYPLKIPDEDTQGLEPNLDRAEPMRAASRLQKLEKTLATTSDELALRGLSRKHRKRLLARIRSGKNLVDELAAAQSDSANGDWQVETTKPDDKTKKSEANKENKASKKKNRKRKLQKEDNVSQDNNKKPKTNKNTSNNDKNKAQANAAQVSNKKVKLNYPNDKQKQSNLNKPSIIQNEDKKAGNKKNKLKKEEDKKATDNSSKVLSVNNVENTKVNEIPNASNTRTTSNEKKTSVNNIAVKEKTHKSKIEPKLVVNKVKNYQKQTNNNNIKKESAKKNVMLETPKKVKFVLKNNSMQGPVDYYKSVRQSPSIPFDSSKKPNKTNLKPSTPSPINPFFKKKFKLKN